MGDPASPTPTRGAGGNSLVETTGIDLTGPVEYRLTGYSQLTKTATASGSSARIYVPVAWAGKRVAVILLDPPDDPLLRNYRTACHYGLMEYGDIEYNNFIL